MCFKFLVLVLLKFMMDLSIQFKPTTSDPFYWVSLPERCDWEACPGSWSSTLGIHFEVTASIASISPTKETEMPREICAPCVLECTGTSSKTMCTLRPIMHSDIFQKYVHLAS